MQYETKPNAEPQLTLEGRDEILTAAYALGQYSRDRLGGRLRLSRQVRLRKHLSERAALPTPELSTNLNAKESRLVFDALVSFAAIDEANDVDLRYPESLGLVGVAVDMVAPYTGEAAEHHTV